MHQRKKSPGGRGLRIVACLALAAASLVPTTADAEATTDVTLFSISKSENRNQVLYAVHVDRECRPVGASPVHAYWQNLERGPTNTSPLLWLEQRAYGLSSQEIEPTRGSGDASQVRVRLRALPERAIMVRTARSGNSCVASATTTVAAMPANMYNVYARLRGIFGVESITLSGRRFDTGAIVQETLKP
jgi:hypothetical protein